MKKIFQSALGTMLVALALPMPFALAQGSDYPTKPVKIIVQFPAGAAADAAMRVVGRKLGEIWNQPVVIENRPSVPGILAVSMAPADGYTLLMGAGSSMVTAPLMSSKLAYHPTRDFAPVGRVLINIPVLTTHPSLKVHTLQELLALSRKKPGGLNYSSSGNGSPGHLSMEMLQASTGTQMIQIPYKGGAPAVNELVGGHVQLGINAVPSVINQIKAGQLTPLAVASAKRSSTLPNVPTMAEAGVKDFEYDIWYALFAPAKTPADVVNKASTALQAALKDPEVIKQLHAQGAEPAPTSADELARFISTDTARWAKLVKERHLKLD